jgi:2-phosphoglycerate kinase
LIGYRIVKIEAKLRTLFSRSYVLGGSPCSGKSTIAERLAREFGLLSYKVDDHEGRHIASVDPQAHPTMFAYSKMSWDQIWSRSVDIQVEEEFTFYRERASMILEDLLEFTSRGSILLEGAAFLPGLVLEWGVHPEHALFLVPTKAFQMEHYAQRPWIRMILDSCTEPEQAFANWMARDHRFGLEIIQQAQAIGYPTILVDGKKDKDALYQQVLEHFNWMNT